MVESAPLNVIRLHRNLLKNTEFYVNIIKKALDKNPVEIKGQRVLDSLVWELSLLLRANKQGFQMEMSFDVNFYMAN